MQQCGGLGHTVCTATVNDFARLTSLTVERQHFSFVKLDTSYGVDLRPKVIGPMARRRSERPTDGHSAGQAAAAGAKKSLQARDQMGVTSP